MIKKYVSTAAILGLIAFAIGTIHFLLLSNYTLYYSIPKVYAFNYVLTLISLLLLFLIYIKFNDKVGFAFLGIGIVKMAISISFLMPLINSDFEDKIPDTLNFFGTYFVFLIVESIIIVRLLNKK